MGEHSRSVVPLAVEFALAQEARVAQRVPARGAAHALLVPQAAGHSEQEPVGDLTVAPGAHRPAVHIWDRGDKFQSGEVGGGRGGNTVSLFIYTSVYPSSIYPYKHRPTYN